MILGVENELGVMNVVSEKITTAITTKFIIVVVNIIDNVYKYSAVVVVFLFHSLSIGVR